MSYQNELPDVGRARYIAVRVSAYSNVLRAAYMRWLNVHLDSAPRGVHGVDAARLHHHALVAGRALGPLVAVDPELLGRVLAPCPGCFPFAPL